MRRAAVPAGAQLLVAYEGRSLAEIVRVMMKTSSNPVAEMLCKAIGVATGATPGTWDGGVAAMRANSRRLGIDLGAAHLVDGSGLSRQNRRDGARCWSTTLRKAGTSFAFGPEFVAALPIAGTDGTLARREQPDRRRGARQDRVASPAWWRSRATRDSQREARRSSRCW